MHDHTKMSEMATNMSRVLSQISSKSLEELSFTTWLKVRGRRNFLDVVRRFPWDVLIKDLSRPTFANLSQLNVWFECYEVISIATVPEAKLIIEECLDGFRHILSFEC
jgi:hypothetical protein